MADWKNQRPANDVDVVRSQSARDPESTPTVRPVGFEETDRVEQTPSGIERRERTVTEPTGDQHRESITRDYGAEQRLRLYKAEQVVWLILGIIEVFVGLRVILKLIGANPANDVAQFIYGVAGFFLGPFFGLTGTPTAGRVVLEVPSIIAMIIYALVAWIIIRVLRLIFLRGAAPSVSTYDHYRS